MRARFDRLEKLLAERIGVAVQNTNGASDLDALSVALGGEIPRVTAGLTRSESPAATQRSWPGADRPPPRARLPR